MKIKKQPYLNYILKMIKLSNFKNLNREYLNLPFDQNNDYSLPFLYATVVIAVNNDSHIKNEIFILIH